MKAERWRPWLGLAAVLLLAWALAGVRPLDPEHEFGVLTGPLLPRDGLRVERGLVLAPPLLFRLARFPRAGQELPLPGAAELMLRGEDGSRFGFRGWATLQARPDDWPALRRAAAGGGLRRVLQAAARAAAGELPPGAESGIASAAFVRSLESALGRELERRGVELRRLWFEGIDFLTVEPGDEPPPADTRLLVIGLDGADWEILDPLIRQGRMPHLARLVERGVRAKLLTISPTLSPVVWTTIATGVEPGRHGVLDFLIEDPEGGPGQPVTSVQRRAATVWEMLSRAGVPVGVVGWWATWPADPVDGYLVTDRIAYQLFGIRPDLDAARGKTWPPELYEQEIRPRIVGPETVPWETVAGYLGGSPPDQRAFPPAEQERLEQFRTLLAAGETYLAGALALRERFPDTRLEIVYFEGTDTVGHLFMRFRAPRLAGVDDGRFAAFSGVVDGYYETADRYLGRLLEGREDWTVMVLSDHGFASDAARPQLTDSRIGHGAAAEWHRRFGMLLLSGPRIRAGARLEEASVYDIAPTVLALFGRPVPRSWPGRVLGRALDPAFLDAHPVRYTPEEPPRMAGGPTGADARALDPGAAALVQKLRSLGYVSATSEADTAAGGANNAGVALLAAGRYAEAERVFRGGLEDAPQPNPTLVVNLGNALRLQGRKAEARELFVRGFEFVATRRAAGHLLALLALEEDDLDGAERYARAVLEVEPQAAEVRTTLGQVLERRGRVGDAEAAYRTAAESDPNAALARNHLGNLARRRGDGVEAERWYRAAIEADPYFMGAYNNLALVHQDRGELDKAIELYSRALTKAPNNAVVLNNLASLYYARGERDEAAALWRRALRVDPSYPSPYSNLASIEIGAGRLAEAERLLRRALELDAEYGDARLNLALVHRAREDWEAMRRELHAAAADPRSRGTALHHLGLLELDRGRPAEALAALEQARAGGTAGADLLNALGECYWLLGRPAEAGETWRASLRVDPGQTALRDRLDELGLLR